MDIQAKKYILYGELFGGAYPHADVPVYEDVQAIQTGVYYSPNIHFCAFDVGMVSLENSEKYYLDYEKAITYLEKHQIHYAKPLWIGKLGEALNFNTRVHSTLPKELALPTLADNLIEGVVIKPFQELAQGSLKVRPIFKLKNPEFEEEKKFHEAQKWSFIPDVTSNSEELDFVLEDIRNYLNTNRLNSAISKVGKLDFSDTQRVLELQKEILEDILTDFNENNGQLLEEISSKQKNWIIDRLKIDIVKFLQTFKSYPHE